MPIDDRDPQHSLTLALEVLMRELRSTFLIGALIVLTTMSLPNVALAATPFPTLKGLTATTGPSTGGGGTLSIRGELPDNVPLPAKIVVPVPQGATPVWVGEIAGTDPSKDPTATYTIKPGNGFDLVTIDLVSSRVGQAEFTTTFPLKNGATQFVLTLPIPGKVSLATITFALPTGSKVASLTPGLALETSNGGRDLYSITATSPPSGTSLTGGLEAQIAAAPAASGSPAGVAATATAGAASSTGSSTFLTPLWLLAYALAATFLGYNAWKYTVNKRATEAAKNTIASSSRRGDGGRASESVKPKEPLTSAKPVTSDEPSPPKKSRKQPHAPRPEAVPDDGSEGSPDASAVIQPVREAPASEPVVSVPQPSQPADDLVGHLKSAAALKTKGVLDADEYAAAKGVILSGETRVIALLQELVAFRADDLLTESEFSSAKAHVLSGSSDVIAQIEDLAVMKAEDLLTREEFRAGVDRLLG